MPQVFIKRWRAEPLRMVSLGMLFTATMAAAVLVPHQIRVALEASSANAAVAVHHVVSPMVQPARPIPRLHQ